MVFLYDYIIFSAVCLWDIIKIQQNLGTEKTVYVVAEGGKQAEPVASTENSSTTDKLSGSVTATVTAGTTYYIYGAGTKARFTAASFTAE